MTYTVVRKSWKDFESFHDLLPSKKMAVMEVPLSIPEPAKTRLYSTAGGRVNVSRYLAGNPKYMKRTTRRPVSNAAFCYKMRGNANGGESVAKQIRKDLTGKIKAGINPLASRIFVAGAKHNRTAIVILECKGSTFEALCNLDAHKLSDYMSHIVLDELHVKSCPSNFDNEVYRLAGYKEVKK